MVNFQIFLDSAHQAELERYQYHMKLDDKYLFLGAYGRLAYDLYDKNWISHIGKNTPFNCKADTKNKRYQEIMFFDWKIQLEKIQLTQDLKGDTISYQGIRLFAKITKLLRSNNENTGIFCLAPRGHKYHISSCKDTRKKDEISSKLFNGFHQSYLMV